MKRPKPTPERIAACNAAVRAATEILVERHDALVAERNAEPTQTEQAAPVQLVTRRNGRAA